MYFTALILWIVFIVGAAFYTQRARHPAVRPVAAFFIFTIVFTTIAFSIFAALTILVQALGLDGPLENPVGAVLFLLVVFAPAFFGARRAILRPPRRRGASPPP